ncbi:MAG TPA: hypothetical protein VMU47_01990 [Caldimonas sp.]|nr:hypothetical protein [Caldimonas sp.]
MLHSTNHPPRGLALALAALVPLAAHAQSGPAWTAIGPPGGRVTAIIAAPSSTSSVWAGTAANGVFVSSDAGATWQAANAGLSSSTNGRRTVYAIRALATDGASVYAATDAGLFVSAGGATPTWSALAAPPTTSPIARLAYEPTRGRLYAASALPDAALPATVFVATLAAGSPPSWSASPLPTAIGTAVASLSVTPPDATGTAHVIASTDNRVYTASVGAAAPALGWVDADPAAALAAGNVTAAAFVADVQQTYACSATALYVSGNAFDASPVWLPASAPPVDCQAFSSVPIANGGQSQVLLGALQGILVSADGTTFSAASTGAGNAGASGFAVAQEPGAGLWTVLAATATGIVAAPAANLASGTAWSARNGPASVAAGGANARLNSMNVVDVAWLGSTVYAACADDDVVDVQVSADGGATWTTTSIAQTLAAGETVIALEADPANGILYAATTQGVLAYVAATHGWTVVAPAIMGGRASALAAGTSAIFAGTDQGIYAIPRGSAPAGAVPIAAGLASYSVRALRLANGTLYAAGIDANDQNWVFSTDEASAAHGTATWAPFGVTSTGIDRVTSLLPVAGNLLAATSGGGLLYASAGSAWASANTSTDPAAQIADPFGVVTALYTDGSFVFAATGSNGIFASPAGTTFTWSPVNGTGPGALPALEVHALRASANALYAATRAGVTAMTGAVSAPPAASAPSPSPAPSAAASSSGGGGSDPALLLGLVVMIVALRVAMRREHAQGR